MSIDIRRVLLHRPALLIGALAAELAVVECATHFAYTLRGSLSVFALTLPMLVAVWLDPTVGVICAAAGSVAFMESIPSGIGINNYLLVFISWVLSVFLVATAARSSRNIQHSLLTRLLLAETEERGRIASDLHDDTIQVMTAALLSMDRVDADVKRLPAYQRAYDLMREAVTGLRAMSFQLHPPTLGQGGLTVALTDLCWEYKQRFEEQNAVVTCHIDVPGRQSPLVEELVYRVALELLQNAWRHAHASKIEFDAHTDGKLVYLTVTDNGVGFDPTAINRRGHHLGLPAKKERVEWARGTLSFESVPGRTRISLVVPCNP